MMKRSIPAVLLSAVAALLICSCDNALLSSPQGATNCALVEAPAVAIGETSATISFDTTLIARCQIEYGLASEAYTTSSVIEPSTGFEHDITLDDLDAATQYFYRVRMTSSSGIEAVSSESYFTTSAETDVPALTGTPAATAGETTCSIVYATSVSARSFVQYGTATGTYTGATNLESSAAASHAATLSGLAPSTTYYYRIWMISASEAHEAQSSEGSFTTSAETDVPALTGTPEVTAGETTCSIEYATSVSARSIVEYGTVTGSYPEASVFESSAGADHNQTLSGLAADTKYFYRIRMISNSMIETTSAEFDFTTSPETDVPALTGTPAATAGETTCSIEYDTSVSARTLVEYGTVSGTYSGSTKLEASLAASHTATLSGLSTSTKYYYRVRMISASGNETLGSESSFTTAAETDIPALNGDPSADASETSCVIGFGSSVQATARIEYGTVSGSYTKASGQSASSAIHSVTLSGLSAATTYYYRVSMVSAAEGHTASSSEFSFTTDSGASLSSASSIPDPVSCALTVATSKAAYCRVEYGTSSGSYSDSTTIESSASSAERTIALSGLSAETTYYYRVRMTTLSGTETVSGQASFATPAYLSTPSATPAVDSLTISWTSALSSLSTIEYGTVAASYSMTRSEASASKSHSLTLSDLDPGTTYYYRIISDPVADGVPTYSSAERSAATNAETAPTLAQKLRGVWLVGGVSASSYNTPVGQVDLYDPVQNVFYASVTTLPYPVSFMGATSFSMSATDHRIYVIGGFDGSGQALSIIQCYSIENDDWASDTGTMGEARANFTACAIYDRIFILGGTSASATTAWAAPRTVFSYVPASDYQSAGSWNALSTAVPAAVGSERLTYAYGDVIYHAGGRGAATTEVATHDGYSIWSNAVTTAAEIVLPSARTGMAGALWIPSDASVSPRVIAVGGFTGTLTGTTGCFIGYNNTLASPGTVGTTVSYLRYPFTGPPAAWVSATGAFPETLGFASAAIASDGSSDLLLVFGGTMNLRNGYADGLESAHRLVLTNNMGESWDSVEVPDMPVGRWGHAALTIQNE